MTRDEINSVPTNRPIPKAVVSAIVCPHCGIRMSASSSTANPMIARNPIIVFISLALVVILASFFILPFLTFSLLAEEPKPKPTISEKARGDFWKASVIAAQADAAKMAADNNKKAAVEALQKDCGDWKLDMDQQKMEPVCVAEQPKESDVKK